MIKINQKELNLIKKIVNYNEKLINEANGDIDNVIDDLITIDNDGECIWNPLRDITLIQEVDPEKEYGEEKVQKFIRDYKRNKG